jgi:carbamoyltransferase
MNILGIIGFGMNPAACILRDGKIIAFAEEERFTRIKVSEGLFPAKAVSFCLDYAKLSLDSIDRIAFGWDATKYPWTMLGTFTKNFLKYSISESRSFHKQKNNCSFWLGIEGLIDYHPSKILPKIVDGLRSAGLKGSIPKIEFVPHHLAHAYSSYFCSEFNNAGILTIDGHGEEICTQLAVGHGENIKTVESIPIPHSLGWFYAAITEYLGFIPYRDEGKLMGLAAFGEIRRNVNKWIEPLSKIVKLTNGSYEVSPIYTLYGGHFHGKRFTDEMVKLITGIDSEAEPISYGEKAIIEGSKKSRYLKEVYIDIAWAAQEILETVTVALAKKLVNKYKVDNICIAGGVGLNCKMNGEILRKSGCKNIFVQPASNDAGTAIGAAMYVAHKSGENIRNPLKNVYLGPEFSNDDIYSVLINSKIPFRKIEKPETEAAKLLEEGKIIGWFQGRMEFGPRALGNRSILANPLVADIKDKVNNEVKYRESWRPFCPSIIDEAKSKYIIDANESSFMTVAYHGSKSMVKEILSIVHVDGTIRPQTVKKENNFLYHSLISEFGKLTGQPILLNTSFNIRGEPIICTPAEAIRCFFSNGLEALIIGDFLIRK